MPPGEKARDRMSSRVLRVYRIIGGVTDARLHEALHRLEHDGRVEYITLGPDDMLRRRLRVATDRGSECAIALADEDRLFDGAVLLLDAERAFVVRAAATRWLEVQPTDVAAAIQLGYCSGDMHWRVAFSGPVLRIALSGPKEEYLARLAPLIASGRLKDVSHG
jgi:urease accessory protein